MTTRGTGLDRLYTADPEPRTAQDMQAQGGLPYNLLLWGWGKRLFTDITFFNFVEQGFITDI
jgi:hypothetical protein